MPGYPSRGAVLPMREEPEHRVQPRRFYHVNELSKDRIQERFARHCTDMH
jgi:hypothetical protein